MSLEALVLALSSVVRPTSTAALYAMLCTRSPQRLLAAYLLAGLAFSVGIGVAVVTVLQQRAVTPAVADSRTVVDMVLGAAALGYAAGTWAGWPRRSDPDRAPRDSRFRRQLQNLSPSGAAVAGVLTHLPGVFYLAALNAIVGSTTSVTGSILQVLVYNAIWYSSAIAALTLSVFRPARSRELVAQVSDWGRRRKREIIVVLFGAVGVYLLVKGLLALSS
ncbi:GAP family protein [Pseudonocardia sp. H11422]|uniref:GAP family protein n=1 Tax=Pseudonocardia sp. H11422 TaxID=2835866 RepID=UPI001BDBE926|nr:GAP family protein [Pseudonocardia sp. H11422]